MIISNILGKPIFLGWVSSGGATIATGASLEIDDKLAFTDEFKAAISFGAISVTSYNTDPYDEVVQDEVAVAIGAREYREELPVTVNGQTIFPLTKTPLIITQVKVFLNSILQDYGLAKEYYVNGSNEVVWNDLEFTLETTDYLEALYDITV